MEASQHLRRGLEESSVGVSPCGGPLLRASGRSGPWVLQLCHVTHLERGAALASVPPEPSQLFLVTERNWLLLMNPCPTCLQTQGRAVGHSWGPARCGRRPPLTLTFPFQDLSSPSQYDTGVALTGLSCFVTPDLARDLANDIMTLVSLGVGPPLAFAASCAGITWL